MGSKTQKPPLSLGFDFQEISEDEVEKLVPITVKSKYNELRNNIFARLEANPVPFKFGDLKGKSELPERERRGICNTITQHLRDANMPWRVSYSGAGKCFVVKAHHKPRKKYTRASPPDTKSSSNKLRQLIEVASRVFGMGEAEMRFYAPARRAIISCGMNRWGIRNRELMDYYAVTAGNISGVKKSAQRLSGKEIGMLEKAIRKEGGANV